MRRSRLLFLAIWIACGLGARAATLGEVVPIGGQAADIALDEARGNLYVANFTAGRIDVVSLAGRAVRSAMHVPAGPSSLALSPDGRYLVIAHFGNVQPPATPSNLLTVIDLETSARQSFALSNPPLGVAFGFDGKALVATTTEFLSFDPSTGAAEFLDSIANVTAAALPAAPATPPVEIVAGSMAASGDGRWIFGLADSIRFSYDAVARHVRSGSYTAAPPLGPRVVAVSHDGSYYAAGWGLFTRGGVLLSQFGNASGALATGTLAIDSASGILYAQVPVTGSQSPALPELAILDADNLRIRERLRIPENLTGRSVLNAAGDTLYAVSESGLTVLPVGALGNSHRLAIDREDLVFQGNFCQRTAITRVLQITDPGGGQTSFALQADLAGVSISPSSGVTPATVTVTIDPAAFSATRGTTVGSLTITSADAVNVPPSVRLLVNNRRPEERGTFTAIAGTLADVLADPVRDRFYVARADRNDVLVFDGSSRSQLGALRTANTPVRLAMTFDRKYLLVGHENSQLIYVYDLDTLDLQLPIVLPAGHYPHSIAASANAILAASRVVGGNGAIDRIDFLSRTATTLASLGVFQNTIATDTVLVPSPGGSTILALSADGNAMLYDAAADTFTVSRKLGTSLSGAFAASEGGPFVAGNLLLNGSLVTAGTWTGSDYPSGFAFLDTGGLRLTGPPSGSGAGGTIERVDGESGARLRATRMTEQPLAHAPYSAFTRTLAPLANRSAVIALTVSGFTVLAWDFDAPSVPPSITTVVNAADMSERVAPGSLISVFGSNLNPTNAATREIPLPTAIGESCLTANGAAIPMMFASPSQINAQLPMYVAGRVVMTLYTPGGVSDDYYLNVNTVAPAIFQSGTAGPLTGLAVVVKASNQQLVTPSNPIHAGDDVSIYATGLGATAPGVAAGAAAPGSPPAAAIIQPEVRLGGVPLAVSYAGLIPGQVGVYRIDARAPTKPVTGIAIPLTIFQGGAAATVTVRVVE